MAMPPTTTMGSTQTTASAQPMARPNPASRGQPVRRGNPCALIGCVWRSSQKPIARIAQQQQEDQHGLLDQRRPLLAGQPLRAVPGQRPRQKEVEDRGNELQVGAHRPPQSGCSCASPAADAPRARVLPLSLGTVLLQVMRHQI